MRERIVSLTKKQTVTLVVLAVVLLIIAILGCFLLKHSSGKKDKVYVQKVSDILNEQKSGSNKYMGVIESEGNKEILRDPERKIQEIYVKEGDEVQVGTKLFSYDVDDAQNAIDSAKIEIESSNNSISDYNDSIKSLEEEKKTADEQRVKDIEYEIRENQNKIREEQLNVDLKKAEIEKNQKIVKSGVIVSTVTGVVKKINKDEKDAQGNETPYIVIYQNDKLRVKGMVEEETARSLQKDQEVAVRSRVNEDEVYKGKIVQIDLDKKAENENEMQGQGSDEKQNDKSSKYPFYVEIEGENKFLLGEHVYVDTDLSSLDKKKGIWLDASYVVNADKTFVWVENKDKSIEKRNVKVKELDENSNKYHIISGLKTSDYIACDMPGLYDGVTAVRNQSDVDYKSPLYRKIRNNANPIGE